MSVVVRRRKPRVSGDSEEFSEDSYDDTDVNKGSQGDTDINVSSEGLRESEYETLDEAGESGTDDTTAVDDEREDGDLSDSVIIEYEREEGDGQEESVPPKEKKLDDDEDRRNPQYIPKRGTFYEHDDRTAAEDTNAEPVEKETERKETEKKKVWKEHENRWSHDRYNEDDQAPKSRDELVAIYGYDIRNEDAPPRARRRRKYGRGPNKYTRNWEDEDAYNKSGAAPPRGARGGGGRGGRGGNRRPFQQSGDSEEEFPPLNRGSSNEGGPVRGGPNNRGRGAGRGRRSVAFPQLPKSGEPDSDMNEDILKEESTHSSTSNNVPNAWKKEINLNKFENTKPREEPLKPLKENVKSSAPMNAGGSNSGPPFKARGPGNMDDKKERVEENGWKGRRDRSKPRQQQVEEGSMEGPSGGEGSWRGRSRGERRVLQGGGTVESQTYTPSVQRGRGRGSRGGGPGRQTMEFKPSFSGPGAGPDMEGPRRSLSETRMSSQEKGNNADGGPYIKSQVVNRTTDDMVKDLGRMTINEHMQPSNREYPRKQNKPPQNYHQSAERRQPVVPPRMQDSAANKPKRYSSQRQRSLPETGGAPTGPTYTQPPQHAYYPPGYAQPAPEEMEGLEGLTVVSSGYTQPPPVYGDAPQATAGPPPGPPPTVVAPQPHTATTTPPTAAALGLLPPPPHQHPQAPAYAPPPFSSPPTFIPPPVAGPPPRILPPGAATFITAAPTGAPIINYVATAPQTQFAPQAYAPFQGFTAVPAAPPPPELFQPQGITYYSPEDQVMQRTVTQKRQSTAIPIVPPPEKGPRGRGRLREEQTPTPPGMLNQIASIDSANGSALKDTQVEDAPEENSPDPAPVESIPSATTTTSSETVEPVSEPAVSSEMIEAMNVTEIPEVSNAAEAAKAIQAVEEAAAAASSANTTSTTITTTSASAANVTPVNVPSTEQETQA